MLLPVIEMFELKLPALPLFFAVLLSERETLFFPNEQYSAILCLCHICVAEKCWYYDLSWNKERMREGGKKEWKREKRAKWKKEIERERGVGGGKRHFIISWVLRETAREREGEKEREKKREKREREGHYSYRSASTGGAIIVYWQKSLRILCTFLFYIEIINTQESVTHSLISTSNIL